MKMKSMSAGELIYQILKYALLIFLLIIFVVPILSIFIASFKTGAEYNTTGPLALPQSFLNFENFKTAFTKGNMLTGFKNTGIVLVFALGGAVLTGSMSAYVFSRFKSKFTTFVNNLFLVAVMIPGVATQVITFRLISNMGLFGTRIAPIILYLGTDIMTIYIFLQFLDNISVSLDESAIIDGANYFQIFGRIILPLLMPAIVTVLITKGVGLYNDYYTQQLYMPKKELQTVSVALYNFKGPQTADWSVLSAAIIVVMIPTLIIFLLLQQQIYAGLAAGSVKE